MNVIAVILIAAFAIDRIVNGVFFLLSFSPDLRDLLQTPKVEGTGQNASAERMRRLIYGVFAWYLGTIVIAGYMNIRLFAFTGAMVTGETALGNYPLLDILMTGLVLMGGADRLAEAMKLLGSKYSSEANQKPLELKGTLILEQSHARLSATDASR